MQVRILPLLLMGNPEPQEVKPKNVLREGEIKGCTSDGTFVLEYAGHDFEVTIDHPLM